MKHMLHTLRNAAAFTALAGVLAASPLMAAAQPGSSQTPPASSTDGIIVLLDQDTSRSLAPAASDDEGAVELLAEAPIYTQLAEADLEVERVIDGSDGVLLELDPAADQSDAQAFEEASKLPGVAEVYYNYIYEPIEPVEGDAATGASAVETLSLDTERSSLANDPYARAEGDPDDRTDPYNLANQYWLFNANVDRAWTQSRTEGAVTVAVLDSGCDLTIPTWWITFSPTLRTTRLTTAPSTAQMWRTPRGTGRSCRVSSRHGKQRHRHRRCLVQREHPPYQGV